MDILRRRPRAIKLQLIVVLVLSTIATFISSPSQAVGFQAAFIRIDRMQASTATGGTVCATPASTATEAKVAVTFPTGFTVNTTAANWTVTTTNLPTGGTAWLGIGTATAVSGQTVTFPSSDLTVGTEYCFNFDATSTLTTSTAGNSLKANVASETSGAVIIDQTFVGLAVVTSDQITISAVVPPIFIFSIDAATDAFTTDLSPTSIVSTGGRVVTVTTNAKGGWIAWVKDSQQGLYSATTAYKIPTSTSGGASPSNLTNGTEGYGLDAAATFTSTGCTQTMATLYGGSGTQAGQLYGTYQTLATCTGTSPATANGDTMSLTERATIAGNTPAAGDYSDVLTVVGAGNF